MNRFELQLELGLKNFDPNLSEIWPSLLELEPHLENHFETFVLDWTWPKILIEFEIQKMEHFEFL